MYVCVCACACLEGEREEGRERGSAYRAWLEFNSLTASGKKLFLSLEVLLRILLSRLPEREELEESMRGEWSPS